MTAERSSPSRSNGASAHEPLQNDKYVPSDGAVYAMNLGKQYGREEADRVKHMVKPMNQEERVLYFSGWWSVVVGHMKAAMGREAACAVVDAMKVLADGSTPSSTSEADEGRLEPDNVGDSDRWQDPRDISGGESDCTIKCKHGKFLYERCEPCELLEAVSSETRQPDAARQEPVSARTGTDAEADTNDQPASKSPSDGATGQPAGERQTAFSATSAAATPAAAACDDKPTSHSVKIERFAYPNASSFFCAVRKADLDALEESREKWIERSGRSANAQPDVERMLGAAFADALQENFEGCLEIAKGVKLEFRNGEPVVRLQSLAEFFNRAEGRTGRYTGEPK